MHFWLRDVADHHCFTHSDVHSLKNLLCSVKTKMSLRVAAVQYGWIRPSVFCWLPRSHYKRSLCLTVSVKQCGKTVTSVFCLCCHTLVLFPHWYYEKLQAARFMWWTLSQKYVLEFLGLIFLNTRVPRTWRLGFIEYHKLSLQRQAGKSLPMSDSFFLIELEVQALCIKIIPFY